MAKRPQPLTLEFSLGGFFATGYWVSYQNGELRCYTSEYPMPPRQEDMLTVQPPPEDWEKLLAFLAGCTWRKEYVNSTCDGIQWELKAKGPGIKLKSWGSNEYPPDFKVFLKLLNECISRAGFRIS